MLGRIKKIFNNQPSNDFEDTRPLERGVFDDCLIDARTDAVARDILILQAEANSLERDILILQAEANSLENDATDQKNSLNIQTKLDSIKQHILYKKSVLNELHKDGYVEMNPTATKKDLLLQQRALELKRTSIYLKNKQKATELNEVDEMQVRANSELDEAYQNAVDRGVINIKLDPQFMAVVNNNPILLRETYDDDLISVVFNAQDNNQRVEDNPRFQKLIKENPTLLYPRRIFMKSESIEEPDDIRRINESIKLIESRLAELQGAESVLEIPLRAITMEDLRLDVVAKQQDEVAKFLESVASNESSFDANINALRLSIDTIKRLQKDIAAIENKVQSLAESTRAIGYDVTLFETVKQSMIKENTRTLSEAQSNLQQLKNDFTGILMNQASELEKQKAIYNKTKTNIGGAAFNDEIRVKRG